MRPIPALLSTLFLTYTAGIVATAFVAGHHLAAIFNPGIYHAPLAIFFGIILYFLVNLIMMNLFCTKILKIPPGYVEPNSKAEKGYWLYLMFCLTTLNLINRIRFLPIPLTPLYHRICGGKIGSNSFNAGIIHDPFMVSIGNDCILGQSCQIIPHAIEGEHLSHQPIKIGNRVTIGAGAVVMQGCNIEDGAIIACNAVLPKGTHVKPNEIWGGVPASRVK